MTSTNKTNAKPYGPAKRLFRPDAMLPPRFVAWYFSDPDIDLKIGSDTIRAWRKAGHFGDRARWVKGRGCISWQELMAATGAWSPTGSFGDMQRRPYASEVVAIKMGISHRQVLDRFRRRKVAGGFKLGAYWYARAADFDAARALLGLR